MTKIAWIGLLAMTLAACSGRTKTLRTETPAATPAAPRTYTYRVIESYPHSTDSYTQGLLFADGVMWEGTGEYGHSRLQRIDLETGRTDVVATLPRSEFGEGIALLDGKIYQLTWENNKAYVYDAATGRQLRTFAYAGEGWGLTTDGERLYMSDGSEYLRILDPETFRVHRSVPVTFRGPRYNCSTNWSGSTGRSGPTSMSPTRSSSSTPPAASSKGSSTCAACSRTKRSPRIPTY